MRAPIVLVAALLATSLARGAAGDVRNDLLIAQGMTGSAGSNSATTGVSPRTDPGPDPSHDADGRPPRTSLDSGTGSPLAGDEKDQQRPNANRGRDAAGPAASPGEPAARGAGR